MIRAACSASAEVSAERQRLVDVTRASVEAGLAAVKPWLPLSVMAEAVQKTVEDAGFSVVREYGGHGIGKEFHEDPFVGFTTEAPDVDTIMAPGMVFTIEPMVNAGAPDIKTARVTAGACAPRTAAIRPSARYSSW